MSRNRAPLEELWLRQRDLVGALSSSVLHDLNNLFASAETNAFLLRGAVADEGGEVLGELEAALRGWAPISQSLLALGARVLPESSALRLEDGLRMLKPLLLRLGRDDLICSPDVAPGIQEVAISSSLFEQGFLALAVLAAELLPPQGELVVVARQGALLHQIELALTLRATHDPGFLAGGSAETDAWRGLSQLVRWLAQRVGGDLVTEAIGNGSLCFRLFMAEEPAPTPPSEGEA